MTHIPLLEDLAVIAGLAVLATVLLSRLHLPAVTGLLFTGALIGPHAVGLVSSTETIEMLSEIGVVLLLFTIGLEFSLARIRHIVALVMIGGSLQVGLTVGATVAVATALGEPFGRALFYGFVFALSSTAIVLKALSERRELDAAHGRLIVGTLIFQDLGVVPMMLVIPLLAAPAGSGQAAVGVALALGKAVLVVLATILAARRIVPRILHWVDASNSREVFLLAVLALCIGTSWITSQLGLSLALGAFLGGMIVADTQYGHRAMGDVLPLRDAFVSIFFVSLGMLFDVEVVLAQPVRVGLLLFCFVFVKGLIATIAALFMRFPTRVAWLAGVGLAQFGEFGFVLARIGESSGLVGPEATRPLLAAGIASMVLTPLLLRAAPHITAGERLLAPLAHLLKVRSIDEAGERVQRVSNHVVIVGYGMAGRLVAHALKSCGIECVALELNAETVRAARAAGEPVYYADATSAEALGHAHLERALALVVLINDPQGAVRVIDTARRVAPHVHVLMRTRFVGEREALLRVGATDVVAEEAESGIEVLARLLRWLDVPRETIDRRLDEWSIAMQREDPNRSMRTASDPEADTAEAPP
jgi:monovalent cation:H+ antiporter-2, CPA2 family